MLDNSRCVCKNKEYGKSVKYPFCTTVEWLLQYSVEHGTTFSV